MVQITAIKDGRAEWYSIGSSKSDQLARELWESKEYEMVEARAASTIIFFRKRPILFKK